MAYAFVNLPARLNGLVGTYVLGIFPLPCVFSSRAWRVSRVSRVPHFSHNSYFELNRACTRKRDGKESPTAWYSASISGRS